MAVALESSGFGRVQGTLARAALAGGVPRNSPRACLRPTGRPTARARDRQVGRRARCPVPDRPKIDDPSPGHITHIRFSSGDAIAVLCIRFLVILPARRARRSGRPAQTLSTGWNSVLGLAWSPDGEEVWFTGTRRRGASDSCGRRGGRERLLLSAPATLTLHDVSRDGRCSCRAMRGAQAVVARTPGSGRERDCPGWTAQPPGISPRMGRHRPGRVLGGRGPGAFDLSADHGRLTCGAPRRRRAPCAVAGQAVGALYAGGGRSPRPVADGTGQSAMPAGQISSYFPGARWLPDGRRFLVSPQ